MGFVRILLSATLVMIGLVASASALSYRDIAGKWCGNAADYTFTRERLIVQFHDGRRTRRFRITDYKYEDDSIRVEWIDGDREEVHTDFGEFSATGNRMAQIPNERGPRRPFRRC